MHLHFSGKQGLEPEFGSDEHLFLVACSSSDPKTWSLLHGLSEEEVKVVVSNLQRMGWGFFFVTLH